MKRLVAVLAVVGLITAACGGGEVPQSDREPAAATEQDGQQDEQGELPDVVSGEAPGGSVPSDTEEPVSSDPDFELSDDQPVVIDPATGGGDDGSEGVEPGDTAGSSTVQLAIADLADRLDVDKSAIVVVSVEEVVWRDGSLGCPQPGMAYTQALVDGSRVVLSHDGEAYQYHAAAGRDPFLCENPAK